MTKIKYITYDNGTDNNSIIFPEIINHDDMAKKIGINNPSKEVLGAGFVNISEKNDMLIAECYGKSVSLNKDSRGKEDSVIVTKDYFGYESVFQL